MNAFSISIAVFWSFVVFQNYTVDGDSYIINALSFYENSDCLTYIYCRSYQENEFYIRDCTTYNITTKLRPPNLEEISFIDLANFISSLKLVKMNKTFETVNKTTSVEMKSAMIELFYTYRNSSFLVCHSSSTFPPAHNSSFYWENVKSYDCFILKQPKSSSEIRRRRNHDDIDAVDIADTDGSSNYAQSDQKIRISVKGLDDVPNENTALTKTIKKEINSTSKSRNESTYERPEYYIIAVTSIYSIIGVILSSLVIVLPLFTCAVIVLMYRYTSVIITE